MSNIFLIRHGESEGNAKKVFQGWLDMPLTDTGVKQARLLAAYLKTISIKTFYSSSLRRAYETAKILALPHGLSVTVLEDFKELNCGDWQGLNRDEARQINAYQMENFLHKPSLLKVPGGESITELQKRAMRGLKYVAEKLLPSENVVVVAHGFINKVLLCSLEENSLDRIWEYPQANTAVNHIEFDGHSFIVRAKNLTPHFSTNR